MVRSARLPALSSELRPLVQGMERADSIAFDLHKWMSVNFDAGCVIVRDPDAHMKSFSSSWRATCQRCPAAFL